MLVPCDLPHARLVCTSVCVAIACVCALLWLHGPRTLAPPPEPTRRLTVLLLSAATSEQSVCSRCAKHEVCLKTGAEVRARCRAAKDAADPTGCGGLCLLERQQCRLLDPQLGIRACLQVSRPPPLCRPGHVPCRRTLMCVSSHRLCDGRIDCPDRSDEQHCACDLEAGDFRCGQGLSCVSALRRCDGSVDCWDAADERHCTRPSCHRPHTFPCFSGGRCLDRDAFCDGVPHCEDGSDEPLGCSPQQHHPNN